MTSAESPPSYVAASPPLIRRVLVAEPLRPLVHTRVAADLHRIATSSETDRRISRRRPQSYARPFLILCSRRRTHWPLQQLEVSWRRDPYCADYS